MSGRALLPGGGALEGRRLALKPGRYSKARTSPQAIPAPARRAGLSANAVNMPGGHNAVYFPAG